MFQKFIENSIDFFKQKNPYKFCSWEPSLTIKVIDENIESSLTIKVIDENIEPSLTIKVKGIQ